MGFVANLSDDLRTSYYVDSDRFGSNCIANKTLEDLRVNLSGMLASPQEGN